MQQINVYSIAGQIKPNLARKIIYFFEIHLPQVLELGQSALEGREAHTVRMMCLVVFNNSPINPNLA